MKKIVIGFILGLLHWALNTMVVPYILFLLYANYFVLTDIESIMPDYDVTSSSLSITFSIILICIEFVTALIISYKTNLLSSIIVYLIMFASGVLKIFIWYIGMLLITRHVLPDLNIVILLTGRIGESYGIFSNILFLCVPTIVGLCLGNYLNYKKTSIKTA